MEFQIKYTSPWVTYRFLAIEIFSIFSLFFPPAKDKIIYLFIGIIVVNTGYFIFNFTKKFQFSASGISIYKWNKVQKQIPWDLILSADVASGAKTPTIELSVSGDYPIRFNYFSTKKKNRIIFSILKQYLPLNSIKTDLAQLIAKYVD